MSRTFKDKSSVYRNHEEMRLRKKQEPGLKRRFLNFKQCGPLIDGERCPECAGLTDFQNGFLTCSECGWTEDIIEAFEFIERTVA